MTAKFDLVVAATKEWGIGIGGTLPWNLPDDIKFFKKLTTETKDPFKMNCCIMGKNTFLSIPPKFRPLSNRINIIISSNQNICW
jgi:dihydrofolate reductase/thymidylate synthase